MADTKLTLDGYANIARTQIYAGKGTKIDVNYTLDTNEYGPMHTRALSDTETPIYGKGTGVVNGEHIDTTTPAGGDYDINGDPKTPGTGRVKSLLVNEYKQNTKEYPSKQQLDLDSYALKGQFAI